MCIRDRRPPRCGLRLRHHPDAAGRAGTAGCHRTRGYLHRSRPPNVGRWNAPTPGTTTSTNWPDAPNADRSSPTSTSPWPTPSSWSADSYAGPGSSTAGTPDPAAGLDLLAHSLSLEEVNDSARQEMPGAAVRGVSPLNPARGRAGNGDTVHQLFQTASYAAPGTKVPTSRSGNVNR